MAWNGIRTLGLLAALSLAVPAAASSLREPRPGAPELPEALRSIESYPALRRLWSEGLGLEEREALLESSQRYEALAGALPGSAFIRWRIARNYWRYGERLPLDDKAARLRQFQIADVWADRSLALDRECGPCILWKLAALGRVATSGNVVKAARMAPTIAEMIDQGIALAPKDSDGEQNSTLGNLYYAGAAFYRILPDWFWLDWVIGVHGDKQRALAYIRKALELHESRVDYRVELGAVLLCMGHGQGDARLLEEGRHAMLVALEQEQFQSTDQLDVRHAKVMLEHPELACGYSRDGWIDLSEVKQP